MSTPSTCRICGNSSGNSVHAAHERMLGLGDGFHYLECGNCGSLQLADPPADLARYYPPGYYSYHVGGEAGSLTARLKDAMARRAIAYRMGNGSAVGGLIARSTDAFAWVQADAWRWDARILDVGCGNGALLRQLHRYGFKHLTGADPFVAEDIRFAPGCTVRKKDVHGIQGPFDLIMLNHAFEHMPDPLATLRRIAELLVPGGHAMIRIPVGGCFAWEHYRDRWVQLDAPRHFFLHTERGMRILAEQSGLHWVSATNDSTAFQFTGSETYLRDLPLGSAEMRFTRAQMRSFARKAQALNVQGKGDTFTFYLRK